MPKKILSYVLGLIFLITAFFFWNSVNRAIFVEEASDFWSPLIWLSFFVVALSLLVILVKEKIFVRTVLFTALGLSFVFAHSFFHLGFVMLAWLFLFWAEKNINEDIKASVKIYLGKSLPRGMFLIVVALALMISSQYYFSVRNLNPSSVAPNISKSEGVSGIINFILPKISPEFKQVKSDEITTDEFLGEMYELMLKKEEEKIKTKLESSADGAQEGLAEKNIESELGRKLTEDEKKQIGAFQDSLSPLGAAAISSQTKQIIIDEWKKELSKSAGFEIEGNEKLADLFVAMVNYKIDNLVQPEVGKEKSSFLPLVFSMLLFVSLVSIGSFVSRLWTIIGSVVFWILKRTGLVKIEKRMVEAEVIV